MKLAKLPALAAVLLLLVQNAHGQVRLPAPGVYVEEVPSDRPVTDAPTSVAAFVGRASAGPVDTPVPVRSAAEYAKRFGTPSASTPLSLALRDFFANGGSEAIVVRVPDARPAHALCSAQSAQSRTGVHALEAVSFNLLVLPPPTATEDVPSSVHGCAAEYVMKRDAVLLIDPPAGWATASDAAKGTGAIGVSSTSAANAALYFPRLTEADPADPARTLTVTPSGAIAGAFARSDRERGVWKAPANVALQCVRGLTVSIDTAASNSLTVAHVNPLRLVPGKPGPMIWGARTLATGNDEWKYIPTRRLALHVERSVREGTTWVAGAPNTAATWTKVRARVADYLTGLWRKGAFQGARETEAFFVRCGLGHTMTALDLQQGNLNIEVGIAAVRPSEFVVVKVPHTGLAKQP
jgi:phage tail sheath protein FI